MAYFVIFFFATYNNQSVYSQRVIEFSYKGGMKRHTICNTTNSRMNILQSDLSSV